MAHPATFERLAEDLSWFVTSPEIRVFHVAAGEDERPIALEQIRLTEAHACNRSPFFVLEDAYTRGEPGWLVRALRVRAIHELRREAMAKEGYSLGDLGTGAEVAVDDPLALAETLVQALAAQATVRELEGLVLVLAPTRLERPERFASELHTLLALPKLSRVRAMVLECGAKAASPLATAFGAQVMCVRCAESARGDDESPSSAPRAGMHARLAAAAAALPGASPEMHAGFAGAKDVVAPTRHGKGSREAALPPEVQASLVRELGPEAALVGAAGRALRTRILGAAAATQQKRFADGIRLQTEARDQCIAAGMVRLACILEITLGTYLVHAGEAARAREVLEASARRAKEASLSDVAAQAHIALAAVLASQRRHEESAVQSRLAGDAAAQVAPMLAVEAYRLAGQAALRAGTEDMAVRCWESALRVAAALPPPGAKASSAALTARGLAQLLQKRGDVARAASLLEIADACEQGRAAPDATAPDAFARERRPGTGTRAESAGGARVRE